MKRHPLNEKRPINPIAGYCIYCGARDVDLTDEHMFPNAMGARHEFLKASCHRCAKIINEEFEQYCLYDVLGPARHRFGIRTDKRRPVRPVPVHYIGPDGDVITEYRSGEDVPPSLSLPTFEWPSILYSDDPPPAPDIDHFWRYVTEMDCVAMERLGATMLATKRIDYLRFARWIAKMGHAFGVSVLGDVFEPILPPLILGEDAAWNRFVGGEWETPPKETRGHVTQLIALPRALDGKPYVIARLRFFASLGAPQYYAVLGPLVKPWPLPLTLASLEAMLSSHDNMLDTDQPNHPKEGL